MSVFEAVRYGVGVLINAGIENPLWEAGILMALVIKKDISYIYAHHDYILSPDDAEKYKDLVCKRAEGMPYQYISQNQEFMSLNFYVDSGCLIPRPETETLVEAALSWIKDQNRSGIRVLDIGTGSGAIAVRIAYYVHELFVDAVEISGKALETAKRNAQAHDVYNRIRYLQTDFTKWEPDSLYDVVISNPPYVPGTEISSLPVGVMKYEPVTALDGGLDGLMFYRVIAAKIESLLKPEGSVFVEVGDGQAQTVSDIFERHGLAASVYHDLAGTERVIRADRKSIRFAKGVKWRQKST